MSYALIDNATLTAVQRVLGQVVVSNPDTVDGDLVAFENLIQAILFYDELLCIDNYKEQHKGERSEQFNFIRFLPPNKFALNDIEQMAKSEAGNLRPEIRGGEFVDTDFRSLLDSLKLNIVCTWDLRSSVYYLTMKMLGQPNTPEFEKYSQISASIFNELADTATTTGRWSEEVKLVSSSGHVLSNAFMKGSEGDMRGTTRALDMFIASLNWIAYKSIYYSIAAKYLKADTFLHPIRHAYQIHWMKKTGAYGHDFTSKLVEALSNKISGSISDVMDDGRNATISLEIPLFSTWLTAQSGDVTNAISSALELRSHPDFEEIRYLLREIRNSYDEHGLIKANATVREWKKRLNKAEKNLKRTYGIDSGQGVSTSFLIKTYNTFAAVKGLPQFPEFEFKVPLPDFVQNNESDSFSNLYKDIAAELTSVERLGGLRGMMTTRFEIDDSLYAPPKTEAPEFRKHASHWKQPM